MLYRKNMFGCASFALPLLLIFISSVLSFAEGLPLEVLPFKFDKIGADSASQHNAWNELMKYKLWGTGLREDDGIVNGVDKKPGDGIVFDGGKIHITDSAGYVGSATGDFRMENDVHSIGGPLIFGGSFKGGTGNDSILIGPSHFGGSFEVSFNARNDEFFAGSYCVEKGFVQNDQCSGDYFCASQGIRDTKATVGCDNKVFPIDKNLDVPVVDYSFFNGLDADHYQKHDTIISASSTTPDAYIDVPPGAIDDMFNVRVAGINLGNNKTLYVRMQKSGRLTRVFLDGKIEITNNSNIRVIQATNDSEWDAANRRWNTSDANVVSNKDYAGNLLIYTPEEIDWTAGEKHLQGTFISSKTITIAQQARFAGQLIAKAIYVQYDFKAEDFRYVRFNPAVIDPTLFSTVEFPESERDTVIALKLNKKTQVKVSFDYCFELSSNTPIDGKTNDRMADPSDFVGLSPICGKGVKSVEISPNTDSLPSEDQIRIHAKLDPYIELYGTSDREKFRLKISNLVGAVLKDENGEYVREGSFDMYIIDQNATPITRDTLVNAFEDSVFTFASDMFPYDSPVAREMAGIVIEAVPTKGTLTYFGKSVAKGTKIPKDSLGELKFVAQKDEYGEKPTYEYASIGFAVYDTQNAVSSSNKQVGTKTLTIVVNPVNDAPKVFPAVFTISGHIIKGGSDSNLKGKIPVDDVDDKVFTYAFDKEDPNFKVVDSLFVIDPNTGSIRVKEGVELRRNRTESLYTIGVVVSDKSASTGVEEDILSTVSKVSLNISYDLVPPKVDIVRGENSQNIWDNPKIIKTNVPSMKLSCVFDGKNTMEECLDTELEEGCHDYVVEYENPNLDGIAYDTVVICLSTAAPVVVVSAGDNKVVADNIYTIVENLDKDDSSTYVNTVKNKIHVTVTDTASGLKKDYYVDVVLDTTGVSKSSLSTMESVIGANIMLDESKVTERVPVNGESVMNSYKVSFKGQDSVMVSYMTDNAGEMIKVPVLNSKGKVDSLEIFTVTYMTKVDGRDVSISYKVCSTTGDILLSDSDGNLMFESYAKKEKVDAVPYTVAYDYEDAQGNSVNVSYGVDKNGNFVKSEMGDIGYTISYTYTNEYGNAATQSTFIVLDRIGPEVKITFPHDGDIIRANFVDVVWEVNGIVQDTLIVQSLEKGRNPIIRFYKDKAGNIAADTVYVVMRDAKNVNVSIEQPVAVVTKEKVEEYYASNPPKKGETYAISVRNPSTGEEVETLIGGKVKDKKGSGKAPYPGITEGTHLGPTLALDIKVPVVSGVGGLATLDDLIGNDGQVAIDGVDAANSEKMSVQQYVSEYCEDGFDFVNASNANLYNIKMDVKIWVYTTLGGFVDYYRFTQELNDPSFANEAGLLQLFFEMKPDKDGNVRSESGRLYATGAYLYKVEVGMKSELKCTLPPVKDISARKKGDIIKTSDDLLKPFGYKRPGK